MSSPRSPRRTLMPMTCRGVFVDIVMINPGSPLRSGVEVCDCYLGCLTMNRRDNTRI
jgi:hypothetical protein